MVNTSEYVEIRTRLFALQNHRKNEEIDPNKPRLRTAPGAGTIPVEASTQDKPDTQDDRPTLKRREWVE